MASGDKNVNVVEIIKNSKNVVKSTKEGIKDEYVSSGDTFVAPRDPREINIVENINKDQTKPTDYDGVYDTQKKIDEALNELNDKVGKLSTTSESK